LGWLKKLGELEENATGDSTDGAFKRRHPDHP
jgi:hypothetical protein